MYYYLTEFVPETILNWESLMRVMDEWKRDRLEIDPREPIAVITNKIYFGKKYVVVFPPKVWNALVVNNLKSLMYFDTNDVVGESTKVVNNRLDLFYNTKTKIGSLKNILQTGHSLLLNLLMEKLINTFRGYIYADQRNRPTCLSMSHQMAAHFFSIYDMADGEVVELPPSVTLYIKRDPVIWMGGVHAVTHVRVVSNSDSTFGVSPFIFYALNMDVDGDTLIGYIIHSDERTKNEQKQIITPFIFGRIEHRWSASSSHCLITLSEMLKYHWRDLTPDEIWKKWDLNPAVHDEIKQTVRTGNFAGFWGDDIERYYVMAKKELGDDGQWTFSDLLQAMIQYAYYFETRPMSLIDFLIELVTNRGSAFGFSHFNPDSILFAVQRACGYMDNCPETFFKKIDSALPHPKDFCFQHCDESVLNSIYQFRNNYIDSSRKLPYETYHMSVILNNIQMVQYRDNGIYMQDKCLVDNFSETIELKHFINLNALDCLMSEIKKC